MNNNKRKQANNKHDKMHTKHGPVLGSLTSSYKQHNNCDKDTNN